MEALEAQLKLVYSILASLDKDKIPCMDTYLIDLVSCQWLAEPEKASPGFPVTDLPQCPCCCGWYL